jgi:hypothetical protein
LSFTPNLKIRERSGKDHLGRGGGGLWTSPVFELGRVGYNKAMMAGWFVKEGREMAVYGRPMCIRVEADHWGIHSKGTSRLSRAESRLSVRMNHGSYWF